MNNKNIIRGLNSSTDEDAIFNADQVELLAVQQGSAVIESGIHDDITSGSLREQRTEQTSIIDEEENDLSYIAQDPGWIEVASDEEQAVSKIAEEILRRSLILGNSYPFKIENNEITYQKSVSGFYEFCLAVSMSPSLTEAPYNILPRSFERFSKDVLINWLGPGAQGWQTGWPGRMELGLPEKLSELWGLIHESSMEWEWQLGKDVPKNADEDQKDLGVDLLVWKPVLDERTGNLFFAGQCACGKDALHGKKNGDICPKWLNEWFRTTSKIDFIPCLLLPRCLGGSAKALRVRAGVLYFDRIRLLLAAQDSSQNILQAALNPYHDLAEIVFDQT